VQINVIQEMEKESVKKKMEQMGRSSINTLPFIQRTYWSSMN